MKGFLEEFDVFGTGINLPNIVAIILIIIKTIITTDHITTAEEGGDSSPPLTPPSPDLSHDMLEEHEDLLHQLSAELGIPDFLDEGFPSHQVGGDGDDRADGSGRGVGAG